MPGEREQRVVRFADKTQIEILLGYIEEREEQTVDSKDIQGRLRAALAPPEPQEEEGASEHVERMRELTESVGKRNKRIHGEEEGEGLAQSQRNDAIRAGAVWQARAEGLREAVEHEIAAINNPVYRGGERIDTSPHAIQSRLRAALSAFTPERCTCDRHDFANDHDPDCPKRIGGPVHGNREAL